MNEKKFCKFFWAFIIFQILFHKSNFIKRKTDVYLKLKSQIPVQSSNKEIGMIMEVALAFSFDFNGQKGYTDK